ncbi:flagellar hook-length control protein FliK [Jannaschia pohangensis]|uniref:Hook-length control protein FliK n=1 Tax=Jannaschia pohangensis TaxID=390807 RepID=A0A1I3NTS4_9RHOB|nr:flagellar hook-length control protein FliK [Jannaschia pohangensis]SFJ12599.1 hook-length control protein FliK [Jannaschia pohangensis]
MLSDFLTAIASQQGPNPTQPGEARNALPDDPQGFESLLEAPTTPQTRTPAPRDPVPSGQDALIVALRTPRPGPVAEPEVEVPAWLAEALARAPVSTPESVPQPDPISIEALLGGRRTAVPDVTPNLAAPTAGSVAALLTGQTVPPTDPTTIRPVLPVLPGTGTGSVRPAQPASPQPPVDVPGIATLIAAPNPSSGGQDVVQDTASDPMWRAFQTNQQPESRPIRSVDLQPGRHPKQAAEFGTPTLPGQPVDRTGFPSPELSGGSAVGLPGKTNTGELRPEIGEAFVAKPVQTKLSEGPTSDPFRAVATAASGFETIAPTLAAAAPPARRPISEAISDTPTRSRKVSMGDAASVTEGRMPSATALPLVRDTVSQSDDVGQRVASTPPPISDPDRTTSVVGDDRSGKTSAIVQGTAQADSASKPAPSGDVAADIRAVDTTVAVLSDRAPTQAIPMQTDGTRAGSAVPLALPELRDGVAARLAPMAETLQVTTQRSDAGTMSTEVELAPADLGRLKLTLQTGDRGLNLVVTVERPESLEMVRRHLDGLHRSFIADGVTLTSIDIQTGARGNSHDGGQSAFRHPERHAPQSEQSDTSTNERAEADATPQRSIAPGRLDISL